MKKRILGTVSTLVVSLFVSTMVSAQTPAGLTHRWSGDGNGVDSAGTADCVTSNLVFTTGHSGQAFSLDGTVFPDFGSNVCAFGSGNFTMDFWIQTTQAGSATIFRRRAWCSPDNVVECGLSDGTIMFQMSKNQDLGCSVQSTKTINDGTFHHIAIVRRSLDLAVYIDGVIDAQSTAAQVISITTVSSAFDADGNPIAAQPDFILGMKLCNTAPDGPDTQFVGALDEVEVYNRALDDTEVYWQVHPGVPIAIVNQPFNQRTLVGRSVAFHVAALGLQPISYQWRFNGSDIPGAISNNLVLSTPLVSDSGTYYCVIDNPAGQVSSQQATLGVTNLNTPSDALMARWSGEGSAVDSFGGNNGTLHNVTFAPGVLGTSFKFNGHGEVDCPNMLHGILTNDFTIDFWMLTTNKGTPVGWGATWSTAVLGERSVCPGFDVWDTAAFRTGIVAPSNGGASNSFVSFDLGTGHPPDITGWQSFVPVECSPDTSASPIQVNDGVFHHVAATRHERDVSIYLDGRWVQTATTRVPINYCPRPEDLWYVQFQLGSDHCDNFKGQLDEVQVHNRALSDSEVYSEYSPDPALVILRQPQASDVVEGKGASLSVVVAGLPPYTYQWQHNGSDISGATDSTYSIINSAIGNSGTYTAVVGNSLQTLTSAQTPLSVLASNSLLPGLVNLWAADGNANDCVGHAEVRTFNSVYATGISGEAFDIGERAGFIDEQTGNFGTNDFTISLWVKCLGWNHYFDNWNMGLPRGWPGTANVAPPNDMPPDPLTGLESAPDVRNILSKGEGEVTNFTAGFAFRMTNGAIMVCGADADGHVFSLHNDAPAMYRWRPDNTNYYFYGLGKLDDTNFHHVVAVRRATTTVELYLDGTLVGQTNLPALTTLDNLSPLALNGGLAYLWQYPGGGSAGFGRRPFNGHVDDIEFYNRALSVDEINGLYQRSANNPQVNVALQKVQAHAGDVLVLKPDRATGPGPLSYQWTFNGAAIANATDSTLTITVDANSAGDYALVVSNPYGAATCPVASVMLALSPGSYNGLFYLDDDATDDTSGYVTLTVTTSQTYSGSILQHGKHYPFTGHFSGGNSVSPRIVRAGKTPLNLNLTMPEAGNLDNITGVVSDGQHVIPVKARRAVYSVSSPTPQAGSYTIAFTGIHSATAPNGHGFGNISISSNGKIQLGASLADGTPATQGSSVANSGEWPLYIPLYGNKGSMLGWLSFTNSPGTRCAGNLRWIKPPGAGGKNYQGGFATKVPVIGSTFVPQASGLGIDVSHYSVVLDGAKIFTPLSNQITNSTGNSIKFTQTGASGGALTAKPGTGQFSGTFVHPVTKLKTPIKGVVLQNQGEAAGYFISGNLSGRVVLKQN